MKRVILVVLAVAMLAAMFAGCAQTAAPASEAAPAAEAGKEPYKMFLVLRMIGDAYYDTIGYGAEEWAKGQPDIDLTYVAPTDYDEALQVALLQDVISQEPDAILVSPISNEACEPVLKEAMEKGIVVICNEAADVQNMNYDLEYLAVQPYAEAWMDLFAEKCGGKGQYATMCGSLQNTAEVARLKAAIAYQEEKYPEMEHVGEIYEPTSDSADDMLSLFKEIMTTYPDVVCILSAQAVAQAALAIEEMGRLGKTWCAGEAVPSEVTQYIENGSCLASLCANYPVCGGAMASLARAILNGEEVKTGIDLGVTGFDACAVDGAAKLVEANELLVITKDNYKDYNF